MNDFQNTGINLKKLKYLYVIIIFHNLHFVLHKIDTFLWILKKFDALVPPHVSKSSNARSLHCTESSGSITQQYFHPAQL